MQVIIIALFKREVLTRTATSGLLKGCHTHQVAKCTAHACSVKATSSYGAVHQLNIITLKVGGATQNIKREKSSVMRV